MTPEQEQFVRGIKTASEMARIFKRALDAEKVGKGDWTEWVRVWKGREEKPPRMMSELERTAREVFNIKD